MVIFLDSNIILDILLPNPDFCAESKQVILTANIAHAELYISATSITDIYYITRKALKDTEKTKAIIKKLLQVISVAGVDDQCVFTALDSDWADFEDALQNQVAQQIQADYIITRNTKDFKQSGIRIVTPTEFLLTQGT